jgi:hypothetical protein
MDAAFLFVLLAAIPREMSRSIGVHLAESLLRCTLRSIVCV